MLESQKNSFAQKLLHKGRHRYSCSGLPLIQIVQKTWK